MSGFGGIKQKYVQNKTENFDRRESSKTTKAELSFTQMSYRKTNTAGSSLLAEKRFSNMVHSDKPRPVRGYLNKNIDLRDQLAKYRTMLNQKYPDPKIIS